MRFLLLLAPLLLVASSAGAGSPKPYGRYVLDVDATYQAMVEAKVATASSRATLEQQKELMSLDFSDRELSLVAGPGLGGGIKGTCGWRLDQDRIKTEGCRQPDGRPFSIGGQITFESDDGAIVMTGNTPVPVRYRAQ